MQCAAIGWNEKMSGVTDQKPLKLIQASVYGVLGAYDHTIKFGSDDDFVIVYGPNGVGKTKTLEVLDGLCRIDGRALSNLPFDTAEILFDRNNKITATSSWETAEQFVTFDLLIDGELQDRWTYDQPEAVDWLIDNTPWRPIENGLWEDRSDGEISTYEHLESLYSSQLSSGLGGKIPEALEQFRKRFPVYLIETQRLRTGSTPRPILRRPASFQRRRRTAVNATRINDQAEVMKFQINNAQTEHSRITQQLDRTFPSRILEASGESAQANDDSGIRARYNEQNEFRSRLGRVVSVPLESELSLPSRSLENWELRLLDLYLSDADQKLQPFVNILRRIELLEDILNRRLLRKKVHVDSSEGISVSDESGGRKIALETLSSGAQHEVILMFDLLFNVPEGALVLIDEPEISLHVSWQIEFIPDVQRIAKIRGLKFIVATHSPQIINDRWDKAIRLGPSDTSF